MLRFDQFMRVARVAVQGSEVMADVLWAVINDDDDQIPGIVHRYPDYKFAGVDKVIKGAKKAIKTEDGQMELLKVYAAHKYDAGFCLDEVSLMRCYHAYKLGDGSMQLARYDGLPDAQPKLLGATQGSLQALRKT